MTLALLPKKIKRDLLITVLLFHAATILFKYEQLRNATFTSYDTLIFI